MYWRDQWKALATAVLVFLAFYWLPLGNPRFDNAIFEALRLTQWYAREHLLLCLVPAFFIAGAIATFVRQDSVMRYLGSRANKILSYGVASVSGTILAVCSCTVLPLFAGIHRRGAGLGPAIAFLYSGPAINVLAIILTARVLGFQLGVARAAGAIIFSVVIGLLMERIFPEDADAPSGNRPGEGDAPLERNLAQESLYFASMVGILIAVNWARPEGSTGFWSVVYAAHWWITGALALALSVMLVTWFGAPRTRTFVYTGLVVILALASSKNPTIAFVGGVIALSALTSTTPGGLHEWFSSSWDFAKQILPLLLFGVLIAGALLGRPGHEGLIPAEWVNRAVGGNSIGSNLFASVAGAFMYFATLTEIPILQGLLGNGMGKGPALALLLAGPALSLPNMLVIRSVIGTTRTAVYVALVVVMATVTGMLFGWLFA